MSNENSLANLEPEAGVERVEVAVTRKTAEHLITFIGDQRRRALHESGHLVLANVLGLRATEVDIKGRDSAFTCVSIGDDDEPEGISASEMVARIIVCFAGMETDRLVLGEHNTGSRRDVAHATELAVDRFACGMHDGFVAVAISEFYSSTPPDVIREMQGESVLATLAEARGRAAELVFQHRSTIEALARIVATERRLTDEALNAALIQVGLTPVGLRGHEQA